MVGTVQPHIETVQNPTTRHPITPLITPSLPRFPHLHDELQAHIDNEYDVHHQVRHIQAAAGLGGIVVLARHKPNLVPKRAVTAVLRLESASMEVRI